MKTIERDVIVVGAGPGGTVCSTFLKRHGLDVLVLEKETFPRDKPCGDGQAGVTTKILGELGWLEGLRELGHENYGIVMTSPDYTKLIVEAPFKGSRYDTPRRIFDHYCAKRTVEEGVELKENAWVYDVLREDGKVCGVKAKIDGDYVTLRAKIVIGADGSHSIVAKKIGMFADDDHDVAVVGRCYYEDIEMEPYNEIHFDKTILPGYVWLFPEKNKMCNVGLGFNRDKYHEGSMDLEECLDKWIETSPFGERLRGKRRVGEFRGWRIPSGTQAKDNVVPGCILIGDAGSMVMPLTGEGIGPAMVTAKLAAQVCREAFDENNFSLELLSRYTRRRHEEYDQKYKQIKALEDAFVSAEAVNGFVHNILNNPAVKEAFTKQWYFEAYEKGQQSMI
jgi:geranylgeranyl reductase family protein